MNDSLNLSIFNDTLEDDGGAITATEIYNQTLEDTLECPTYSSGSEEFLAKFSYWSEGIIQSVMGALGILGNLLSCFILTRRAMRNAFNLLLVTLATYDIVYLVGAILESFRKHFDLGSTIHVLMFPKFLYPLHHMSMTGSIFMTVAIAFERYSAVHYPLDYNQVSKAKLSSSSFLFLWALSCVHRRVPGKKFST